MKPITEISSSHMGDMFLPLLEVQTNQKDDSRVYNMGTVADRNFSDRMAKDDLLSQDSLGRWMNEIIVDSPESVNDPSYESSVATSHGSIVSSAAVDHEGPVPAQIFCITDLSPSWAYSTEETKVRLYVARIPILFLTSFKSSIGFNQGNHFLYAGQKDSTHI